MKTIHDIPLIHYGNTKYDETLFEPIGNDFGHDKPSGGLWTNPITTHYGWDKISEMVGWEKTTIENSFQVQLKPDARVLIIDKPEDVQKIPTRTDLPEFEELFKFMRFLDFKSITDQYDAIHLTLDGLISCKRSRDILSWDYEAVLIMNKDCFTVL